ncbi:MAG TPA: hypothetical protein VMS31_13990 [Pyrinomonadaceae bacterium]|nr:hypothetical protein [Pyrinomonadaceae bacterium]
MRFAAALLLTLTVGVAAYAQRPRTADPGATDASKAAPAPAPQSMAAKYEGGVFGHNNTLEGTLSFDDTNERLLFRNKKQKELFFIPYNAVVSAFADTQKRRPAAATVAQNIPYIGYPLGLIKTKVQYLTLQYNDPDTNVSGITSFRLANKQLLDSVVYALANKAGLQGRGEIYVRKTGSAKVKEVTMP